MADYPEMIGKYRIQALVAKGGMGAVYKAVHPTLKRFVIIKKLTIRGNAAAVERFRREAQILLDLNNPHIVHLYDYFQEGAFHYIVIEYVDGMSLDLLLKKKKTFSNEMALLVVLEAALALKYAHDHGIVHRDVKPGNILISRKGEIKLADFGIASSEAEGEENLTRDGVTLGTPSYMPPEQFADSRNVDRRADLYALGVMLYEMVTGTKPFPGKLSPETVSLIQKGRYTAPEKVNPAVSPFVSRLIRRMIRKDPGKRYQDAGPVIRKVRKELSRFNARDIRVVMVENLTTERTDEPQYRHRRHTVAKLSLAASALVVFVSLGAVAWQSGLIHRTILSPWYTPVSVLLSVPDAVSPESDIRFRAAFFRDDGTSIPEVPGARRELVSPGHGSPSRADSASAGSAGVLASGELYLRPGAYRVKVTGGPRVWWESVTVKKKRVDVAIDFGELASRPLAVHASAVDAVSGMDLTARTQFLVLSGNRWIPLDTFDTRRLVSASVWKIRAVSPGYRSQDFSLRIEWFQDELFLRSALEPDTARTEGEIR